MVHTERDMVRFVIMHIARVAAMAGVEDPPSNMALGPSDSNPNRIPHPLTLTLIEM